MRSPRSKNSSSAITATIAAATVRMAGGAHHTRITTTGIRTSPVRMRTSIDRLAPHRAAGSRGVAFASRGLAAGRRSRAGARRAKPAIAALALLVFDQRLEQARARKIGPERVRDVY